MASNLERIRKACAEMKRLYGTPETNVKAALKHLLTFYRNAWDPIEENNYKAILEWALKNNKQGENKMDYSKKRSALLIQEGKKLESQVVHVLSDDESEEPEPPLKWRKRNHNEKDLISVDSSNLQLSKGSSKRILLDEAAPETKEPAQPSPRTIRDLKMSIADAAPNGGALFFDHGGNKKDMVDYYEDPLDLIHPELLTNGQDNGQCNSNKQPNRHEPVGSQDIVNKLPHVSEHVHVDTCNDKYIGNSSAESEKKMMDVCNGGDVANPFSMEDDQKHQPPLKVTKRPIFVDDISRGEENEPISLVSDNGSSFELPRFFYISRNIVYRSAYVKFPLDRISDHNCCSNCSGDCLSAPANCACTSETRGDFAYTRRGLVEEKFLDECIGMSRRKPRKDHLYYCENCPLENTSLAINGKQQKRKKSKKACKGHLMRKFIKECWAKCGCRRNCGNRVVQRGITVKLQVFQTPQGKGWGVRTLEELEKGTFVCEYVGEIVTNQELHERNEESAGEEHTYPVLLDADWASERHLKDEEALCLDATKFGNVARFINHRCYDANLVEIPVEVETPDHHYYHIAFFTSRKIEANEELTWDYGIDFDDETHPIKAFECKCGSVFCCTKNWSSC